MCLMGSFLVASSCPLCSQYTVAGSIGSLVYIILVEDSTLGTFAEWRRPYSRLEFSFCREVQVLILIFVLFLSPDFLPFISPLLADASL